VSCGERIGTGAPVGHNSEELAVDLIRQLQRDKRLYAQCPSCLREFQLSKAILFHLKKPLPREAEGKLRELSDELRHLRADLKMSCERATTRAECMSSA